GLCSGNGSTLSASVFSSVSASPSGNGGAPIPPLQSPQDRPSSASPSHWIPCRLTEVPRRRPNRSSWQTSPLTADADLGTVSDRSLALIGTGMDPATVLMVAPIDTET